MNLNLNQIFNRSEFIEWVNDFLPNFNLNIQKVDVPKGFKGATSIETLGESELGVRVFIIETDNDPSKRRIGWATDSFSVLKNSGSSNALMVYFSQETSQWRLSLLTSSPVWGDGKVILKLSNPKRQSYVLGPKAKVKTPQQFLINKGRVINLDDLKTRFSLEVVNKEFYKEISKLFTELVGGTVSVGKKKIVFEPLIKLPSIQNGSTTSLEFAVRLIGRIIFCWFLREKHSTSGNSLMPKELVSLESVINTTDYYHRILEPIFYEVLNKPQKTRNEPFDDELFSKIPYLNGGLFSPQEDDFYKRYKGELQSQFHNTLIVPDKWIKSFFEVLETYNFTIDENTSFDEELSIDPEMLGRIFENLLAEINPETGESARKSTGSYYTPRIIVDYMVDESLCLYLKEKTGIEEKKLKSLISYDLEDDLPLNDEDKDKIIKYLGDVKILDPACGSGAFPIGALQKIVFILQQIDPDAKKMYELEIKQVPSEFKRFIQKEYEHGSFDYLRKLRVIRDCIYGVDIQPIATEISRLRCFLTLVVDQRIDDTQENRGIQPLPNLDFKFVTANSLIGLPKVDKTQGSLFDNYEKIDELKGIRDDYFSSTGIEREQLKTEFVMQQKRLVDQLIKEHGYMGVMKAELTQKLTDWEPFTHKPTSWFDPEWMFGIKDGFDIVIANPPYIFSRENINQEQKDFYHKNFILTQFKLNLYVLFIEKSFNMLGRDGNFAFIIPNNWLTLSTASKLRHFVLTNTFNTRIVLHYESVFESASVDTCLLLFKKSGEKVISFYSWDKNSINLMSSKNPDDFLQQNGYVFGNIDSKSEVHGNILSKIESISSKLGIICDVRNGVQAYTVGEGNPIQTKEIKITRAYHSKVKNDDSWLEYFDGADINRYFIKWSGQYIKYGANLSRQRNPQLFKGERLLVRQIPAAPPYCIVATYTNEIAVVDNNCLIIKSNDSSTDLKFVLGLINSRVISYWFIHKFGKLQRKTFPQFKVNELREFPIFKSNSKYHDQIIKFVDECLKKLKNSNSLEMVKEVQIIEKQIDLLVYRLYNLTEEEIKIVEGESKNG